MNVVVTHAPGSPYVAAVTWGAGVTAKQAHSRTRDRCRQAVPDHAAFRPALWAVEVYGAWSKLNARPLACMHASGRMPEGSFVQWGMCDEWVGDEINR